MSSESFPSPSSPPASQASIEDYLVLVLSDSNLPTGGFIASSGLESTYQHGFLLHDPAVFDDELSASKKLTTIEAVVAFIQRSLHSYARLALPFLNSAHEAVAELASTLSSLSASTSSSENKISDRDGFDAAVASLLERLAVLDRQLDSMMLSAIARRASKAQGTALLTLHSRAFAELPQKQSVEEGTTAATTTPTMAVALAQVLVTFKSMTRRDVSSGGGMGAVHAHLPICWAILTATLGLSLGKIDFHSASSYPMILNR
jgi:urease accessory protein